MARFHSDALTIVLGTVLAATVTAQTPPSPATVPGCELLLLNIGPMVLLVIIWIFCMKRLSERNRRPTE
jgi:hypothetical protein